VNLQQLYYFKAVAELEHYTLAANKLIVSQSSLSHAISDLEKELGVPLFSHHGRNIKLNKYGELFLQYVTKSLDILDEGKSRLHDFISPETGTVSLGYLNCLNELIPYLVSRYYTETNRMQTSFQFYLQPSRAIYAGLQGGSIDLALCMGFESGQFNTHKIGTHDLVVIVSKKHPFAALDEISLADLKNEKIFGYNDQCQLHGITSDLYSEIGMQPDIVSENTNDSIIISSVAANLGVGIIPRPLMPTQYNTKILTIRDDIPPLEYYLVWKKSRYLSPVIINFRNFLLEHDSLIDEFLADISAEM